MMAILKIPAAILFYEHIDLFRVFERQEDGIESVSDDVNIDEALLIVYLRKMRFPKFTYTIVPVFKISKN